MALRNEPEANPATLLKRLENDRVSSRSGADARGHQIIKDEERKRAAKFKRTTPVSLLNDPEVYIGDVISPPGLRNSNVVIGTPSGGRRTIPYPELEVWKPPAQVAK